MGRRYQIAIAGCGPAGLAAALLLARDGHEITLFERFPAPRPLGSGLMLQPSGMAVLAALGLAEAVIARGAKVTRLLGCTAAGRTALDARYADLGGPDRFGLGIHRASLFDVLFGALAETDAKIVPDHEIVASRGDRHGRWLSFPDGSEAGPFALVIDALGLNTPLAPNCGRALPFGAIWFTLPWPEHGAFARDRLEQRYRAAREMVGVLPIGQRPGHGHECALFWSLKCADFPRWQDRGLATWRGDVAALWPDCAELAEQVTDPAQATLARYAHRRLPRPAGERIVHIGDAWHTASPQLGQGANMALLDAFAVAQALRLTRDPISVPAMAVQLRSAHVALYQWATAFFTPFYQSDSALPAWTRDWLFAPASQVWPGKAVQAQLMSGLFGRPLRPLGLGRYEP